MYIHSSTTLHALRQLLGTVILVQEVMGDLLQVGQMTVEQGGANGQEVRVARVVDLDNSPRVLASANLATANLDSLLRTYNSEWHQTPKLGVLFHSILVVLLNIIREVVNGDAVVLDVLHDQLLGLGELGGSEGVGTANDGDDVDTRSKALHQLDVQLAETVQHVSGDLMRCTAIYTYPWPVGVMK